MNPAPTAVTQREYFSALADAVCIEGADVDRCSLLLKAEDSHFIRFNHGRVRQATHVAQGHVTLSAMQHARRIESRIALSGRLQDDIKLLRAERAALAHSLADVPDDPYLLLPSSATHSERHDLGSLPDPDTLVRVVVEAAAGLDFVGFYAGGPVVRAFADNLGTRHWHHVQSFHLEWCLYLAADRAVKSTYAGTQWSHTEFARRVADAARSLQLLAQPAHTPPAGDYRAYIAPAAMAELLGTLSWSGFGLKARRTGTSSLMRLAHRDASLHGDMNLIEDTAHGLAPAFTADGFARPASVPLVLAGVAAQTLNSARSAREFGLQNNGANAQEVPESLNLAAGPPGRLPQGEALAALDRGLYIANLWYLNYSDRPACRMTGMTRFACLWVEGGRAVAPLSVMRFDDSFLRLFGEGLIGLGDSAELIADGSTYQERQLGSVTTPGALVEGLRLTL